MIFYLCFVCVRLFELNANLVKFTRIEFEFAQISLINEAWMQFSLRLRFTNTDLGRREEQQDKRLQRS